MSVLLEESPELGDSVRYQMSFLDQSAPRETFSEELLRVAAIVLDLVVEV
ncbi:MAG: hypothetical protein ABF384_18495 [Verrucomicrobiales bacterium]